MRRATLALSHGIHTAAFSSLAADYAPSMALQWYARFASKASGGIDCKAW
ncbi:MAG TPA: hypothetical protein VJP76_09340 [Candidatus Tumulicola sp.]|nr:hypothetical protein [Candidatus Tumulicola sp.]